MKDQLLTSLINMLLSMTLSNDFIIFLSFLILRVLIFMLLAVTVITPIVINNQIIKFMCLYENYYVSPFFLILNFVLLLPYNFT